MTPISFKDAAKAVNSASLLEGTFDNVCTDSRQIIPGCLFIALKGENFDGNGFAPKAIEDGASCVMVERDCGLGDRQIIVEDTRTALLQLAGYYRSLFNIPVIGVTGSVGKTTTKEMTYLVMSSKYDTLKNEGNRNNEIGVPLTLFRLEKHHEAAVIEMGMSGFGEISRMTAIVKPDVAIISNIGVSHIENLGSREGILKAKLEILEGMKEDAPVIFNGDDNMLSKADTGKHPVTYYGLQNDNCAYKALSITSTDDETASFECSFRDGTVKACLPFTGRHNIYNALAATAAGSFFGIDAKTALEALKQYKATGMRQKMTKKNGITFIEDCYNASPDSQAAAMAVLGGLNAKRRIAVTGDMLELGDYSETAHRLVGKYAADHNVDILFTYGERAKFTAESGRENGIKDVRSFTNKSALINELSSILKEGDTVLFKASRGMKLEEVIYGVYDRLEEMNE